MRAIFDLNLNQETDGTTNIRPADTARYKPRLEFLTDPTCAACTGASSMALSCSAGAQGSCN